MLFPGSFAETWTVFYTGSKEIYPRRLAVVGGVSTGDLDGKVFVLTLFGGGFGHLNLQNAPLNYCLSGGDGRSFKAVMSSRSISIRARSEPKPTAFTLCCWGVAGSPGPAAWGDVWPLCSAASILGEAEVAHYVIGEGYVVYYVLVSRPGGPPATGPDNAFVLYSRQRFVLLSGYYPHPNL